MNKYDNLLKEIFSDDKYKINNINKLLNLGYILRVYDEKNNEIFLREVNIEEDNENKETRKVIMSKNIDELTDDNINAQKGITENQKFIDNEYEFFNNLQCDFMEVEENNDLINYSNVFNPNGIELYGKKGDVTSLFTYNAMVKNNYENKLDLYEINNKFIDYTNKNRYVIIPSSKRLVKDIAYKGYEAADNNPEEDFSNEFYNYKMNEGSIVLGLDEDNKEKSFNHLYIHDIEEIAYFCPDLKFKEKTESFELLEDLIISYNEDGISNVFGNNKLELSFEKDENLNATERIILKNNNNIDFKNDVFASKFKNKENISRDEIIFENIEEFLDKGDTVFELINKELYNGREIPSEETWKNNYNSIERELLNNTNDLCNDIIDNKVNHYIDKNVKGPKIQSFLEQTNKELDELNIRIKSLKKENKIRNKKLSAEINNKKAEKLEKINSLNSELEKLREEKENEYLKLLKTLNIEPGEEKQDKLNSLVEESLLEKRKEIDVKLESIENDFIEEIKRINELKGNNPELIECNERKKTLEHTIEHIESNHLLDSSYSLDDDNPYSIEFNKIHRRITDLGDIQKQLLLDKIQRAPLKDCYFIYRNQVESISNNKNIKIEEIIDNYIDNLYKEDDRLIFFELYDRKTESRERYYKDLKSLSFEGDNYKTEYKLINENFSNEMKDFKDGQGKYVLLDLIKSNDIDVRMSNELIQLRGFYKKNINEDNKEIIDKNIISYLTANPKVIEDNSFFIDKYLENRNINLVEKLQFVLDNSKDGLVFEMGDSFFKYRIKKDNDDIIFESYFNNIKNESVVINNSHDAAKYIMNTFPKGYIEEIKEETSKLYNKNFSGELLESYSNINTNKEHKNKDLELFVKNIGEGKIGIIRNIYDNNSLSLIKIENNAIFLETIKENGKEKLENFNSTNIENFDIETKMINIEELNTFLRNNINRDTSYSFKKYPYNILEENQIYKNNNKVLAEIVKSTMENPKDKFLNHLSKNIKKMEINSVEDLPNKNKNRHDIEIFDFEHTRKILNFSLGENGNISVRVLDICKNNGEDNSNKDLAPISYQFKDALTINNGKVVLTENGLNDENFMNLFNLIAMKDDQIYETKKSFSKFFRVENNEGIIEGYDPIVRAAKNINNLRYFNVYHKEILDMAENGFDEKNTAHKIIRDKITNNTGVTSDIGAFCNYYKDLYTSLSSKDIEQGDLVKDIVFIGKKEEIIIDNEIEQNTIPQVQPREISM